MLINNTELQELYRINEKFRRYVDKYCQAYNLSLAAALEHAIVKLYAKECMEVEDGKENDTQG